MPPSDPMTVPQAIETVFPVTRWAPFPTLVAVSGGPDSVALLRALLELAELQPGGGRDCLRVAHIHHGVRGPAADADAAFVERLATSQGLSVTVRRLPPLNQRPSEERLRQARYQALVELAGQLGARYLVTGHHQGDQAETILFRILRGTGIGGLAGMRTFRQLAPGVTLVRPLLDVTPDQLRAYLTQLQQDYREDATNTQLDYARNYLRQRCLPELRQQFGAGVDQALVRLADQARQADELFLELGQSLQQAVRPSNRQLILDRSRLVGQAPLLLARWLIEQWDQRGWPRQDMTQARWESICQSLMADHLTTGAWVLPGAIEFRIDGSEATFARRDKPVGAERPAGNARPAASETGNGADL